MASAIQAFVKNPAVLQKTPARLVSEALGDALIGADEWRGDLALTVTPAGWVKAATLLRDHPELDYKLFLDLCGVDYLEEREDRFEVVLHVYSVTHKHHIRLKVPLPESRPSLPT